MIAATDNAKKIRFGLAGTGFWARAVHLPGLESRPDVELAGVWGRDQSKAAAIAEERGIAAFARFEDLLAAVDAVSFAVPPAVQGELALAAALAGKHLLLEKPLAASVAQAQAVAEEVARSKVASVVFFTRRFIPEIEQAVQLASGQSWERANVRVHSAALSTVGPYDESWWRHAPGAESWDIGPHVLSMLIPILGPVVRMHARRPSADVTTYATVHERGALAEVSLTMRAAAETTGIEYRFSGGGGSLILPEPDTSRQIAYSAACGQLAGLIRNGETAHRCGVDFGLDVVRILAAADRSIASGAAVDLA